MKTIFHTALSIICCLMFSFSYAQGGFSSGSMGMSQQKSATTIFPRPAEVIEEEYFNYHLHDLPAPQPGTNIALSSQHLPLDQNRHLLQVGIRTTKMNAMVIRPALNLSILIDKSGSMQADDKLIKSKRALMLLLDQLQPEDRVSIVAFDDGTEVVFPAQALGNGQAAKAAVSSISIGGSTNMEAGIGAAYRALLPTVEATRHNRMIILTDALTNAGVVDPEQIVQNTEGYRSELTLSFAMIGVGIDFNYELTRLITANGRDQVHFIYDAAQIEKIFAAEAGALLYPIAQQPVLHITLPPDIQLETIYGYAPNIQGRIIQIPLRDLNADLTQVVLLEISGPRRQLRRITTSLTARNDIQLITPCNPTTSGDLLKNLCIARMAHSLQDMAIAHAQGHYQQAQQCITQALLAAQTDFPSLQTDADLTRMTTILKNYQQQCQYLSQQ